MCVCVCDCVCVCLCFLAVLVHKSLLYSYKSAKVVARESSRSVRQSEEKADRKEVCMR